MKRDPTPPSGCSGEGCASRDPWPLHHVRHRGAYLHLCTSCVLRHHPAAFCAACFDLLSDNPPLAHCAKCPAAAHLSCLPDPTADPRFLCPTCSTPHPFSYFPDPPSDGRRRRAIDLPSAKALLASARLASASMARAASVARADVDRKFREASAARRRARELLERVLSASQKSDKEEVKSSEPKSKRAKIGSAVAEDSSTLKKFQERQRERMMRFQEIIRGSSSPRAHSSKAASGVNNHAVANEEEMKGITSSQSVDGVNEEDVEIVMELETAEGVRVPQPNQGGLVSGVNSGAVFTDLPKTARFTT